MLASCFPANRDSGQLVFQSIDVSLALGQRRLQLLQFGLVRRPFRAKLRKLVGKLFQFRFFCLKQSPGLFNERVRFLHGRGLLALFRFRGSDVLP